MRIEVWFAVKFSQHLWIYLCENILISYFQFLRLFVFTLLKQLSNTIKFQGKSTRRISFEVWLVLEGVFQKNFLRERPPQKEWGGFQRGVRPPKKLCKFNSIMPANAKDACKCRKQCHNEKYRATLQTKIFEGINAFCISNMTFSAFKEPSYNFNISFLLNFNNRETERCYYRRQKRNRKTPVLESF